MKTTLPERSQIIKERLDLIIEEILATAKSELAMVILFGSYARGDWVNDSHAEDHTTHGCQSDSDVVLATKSPKHAAFKGGALQTKIEKRLDCRGLGWQSFMHLFISKLLLNKATDFI